MEIDSTSIRATGALYYLWQLEQMRVFDVADRLCDLFATEQLPISSPAAEQLLAQYFQSKHMRLTGIERTGLYNAVFVNGDFQKRWSDLLASVMEIETHPSSADAMENFRKSGYSLALVASAAGGGSSYAIQRVNAHAKQAIEILMSPAILNAFAANSMYQLIEKFAQLNFGGSVNTPRYRNLAEAGSHVLQFMADHISFWPPPIRRAIPRVKRPRSNPTMPKDDLGQIVKSAKSWLSANGGASIYPRTFA